MKILIVKLGYSETLDHETGRVASPAEVLRATPILWAVKEKFPDSQITWLVSEQAEPLLRGNAMIDRILVWDEFVAFQLMREKIDILINLEKIPGVAALCEMIDAWTRYGFRFDGASGRCHSDQPGLDFHDYVEGRRRGQIVREFGQKVLIEMLGVPWRMQRFCIGYQPATSETFDAGLNYNAESGWPTKALPLKAWKSLEKRLLELGLTVSWPPVGDLFSYMDWINSCSTVISQDGLGFDIARTFGKRTVGLFGPTDPEELYLYDCGEIIYAEAGCPLKPCYNTRCLSGAHCMESIGLDRVVAAVTGKGTAAYPGSPFQSGGAAKAAAFAVPSLDAGAESHRGLAL